MSLKLRTVLLEYMPGRSTQALIHLIKKISGYLCICFKVKVKCVLDPILENIYVKTVLPLFEVWRLQQMKLMLRNTQQKMQKACERYAMSYSSCFRSPRKIHKVLTVKLCYVTIITIIYFIVRIKLIFAIVLELLSKKY